MSYPLYRWLARTWFRLCYGFRAVATDNIPRHGGVILASNHQSFLDPMAIAAASTRTLTFLARESLARNRLYRLLTASLPIVAIERGAGDRAAIRRITEELRRGAACLVFPEGTRSERGLLGELRSGVVMMARQAEVPVVPVAIAGAYAIWPRGNRVPRLRGRLRVAFGRPLELAQLSKQEALDRLRGALLELGVEGDARPATDADVREPAAS